MDHCLVRLCTCTHLVKEETLLVLGPVIDEYVKYGMGVFEYEHERQQVLVHQKEDVTLEMQEGVCSKKFHTEVVCHTKELGVALGGSVDSTFGFNDDEGNEDTPQEMTETDSTINRN